MITEIILAIILMCIIIALGVMLERRERQIARLTEDNVLLEVQYRTSAFQATKAQADLVLADQEIEVLKKRDAIHVDALNHYTIHCPEDLNDHIIQQMETDLAFTDIVSNE